MGRVHHDRDHHVAAHRHDAAAPATTLERTVTAGEVARAGTELVYRRLAFGAGEPRLVREDLARRSPGSGTGRRSLLVLVQLTDLQLADVQSPARFEFFEALRGQPGVGAFVPAQRPQELLGLHALDAMASSIRAGGISPDTGAPLGLALCTGDNVDNAQLNELTWFLSLLSGGEVNPDSGGPVHEGVQAPGWPADLYWHPEAGADRFKERWGFLDYPGLLDEAARPFRAGGLGLPWLSCFGNHDGLPFGEVVPTAEYRRLVVGSKKPVRLPAGLDPRAREDELFANPERFLAGPWRAVTADPGREIVSRRDFVEAHLRAPGAPAGHGFDDRNVADGTAYGVFDEISGLRVILLDTTNLNGRSDGSIGARQLAWLEERLAEVHSRAPATKGAASAEGAVGETGREDRLVILASHHGLASMTNDREDKDGPEPDQPRATADEVRALIHRFPNVVLWLNGHRHCNEVALRRSPANPEAGFWEVSTVALADWPSQARLVELVVNSDGTLSVLCTMMDHLAHPDPRLDDQGLRLAGIHREVAANVPGAGLASSLSGRLEDRNVELVLRAPFSLR